MSALTKTITTFLLLLFMHMAVAGDNVARQTYIIELKNQVPETLIPAIKPALATGDGISGFNNELIITTDTQRIESIRQLVSTLDKPLRNLLISVKNNHSVSSQENHSGFSGTIKRGSISVNTGEPIPSPDNGVTVRADGLSYSTGTSTRSVGTRAEQQLRAVEGSPAFIYSGESRLVPNQDRPSGDRYGNVVSTQVNANKGFYVTARLIGERVQLDILVSNDAFDQSSPDSSQAPVSTQQLRTTVNGRIGEWISLGGITLGDNNRENSLAKKITTQSVSLGDISVRVSPLEP